jgi:hypothetical protein
MESNNDVVLIIAGVLLVGIILFVFNKVNNRNK